LSSFKKALTDLDKAVQRGAVSALNKALAQTKTQAIRRLKQETGLKTEDVKVRVRGAKASLTALGIVLGLATKFGTALRKFGPKVKNFKVRYHTGKAAGKNVTRQGVTVKIGNTPRAIVPGAFVLDRPQGLIVVGRKDAFVGGAYLNRTAHDFPTVQLTTNKFIKSAEDSQPFLSAYMKKTFDRIVNHEIDFALKRKFNKK
jgi:hypothetical protein